MAVINFQADFATDCALIEISRMLIDEAANLVELHELHAYDAVQLVATIHLQLIKQNPVQLVDPPPLGKREMNVLDHDQVRGLLKVAEKERYYPVFVFLLSSGCRPSEAFGLKWSDVDWRAGSITIRKQKPDLPDNWLNSQSRYWTQNKICRVGAVS